MGKFTISMAIFNSYVSHNQRVYHLSSIIYHLVDSYNIYSMSLIYTIDIIYARG